MSDQNAPKPVRGRPFPRTISGNPSGRPRGSKNRTTLLLEAILEGHAVQILDKIIELGLDGNINMLGKCLERILPRPREPSLTIDLPPVTSAADSAVAKSAILEAIAAGKITIDQAERLGA
jgi:hypothetical protein